MAIDAGGGSSLALKSDGTVLAWGVNASGQLGVGDIVRRLTPTLVSGLGFGSGVVAIDAGAAHSLALKSDGTVLAWGLNATGQLGDGTTIQRTTPVQVKDPADPTGFLAGVKAIAAGSAHSLALKSDDTVLAWGSNASGQLGDGTLVNEETPVQVHDPSGTGFLTGVAVIAAGAITASSWQTRHRRF